MKSDFELRTHCQAALPPTASPNQAPRIAVVIPCFRATGTIAGVLRGIGPEVGRIYVVDDGCPDASGDRALRDISDPRLGVLHNESNLGVGGAMKRGYARALADGAEIVVKLDADGQMDPSHISRLIAPILKGTADYAKGNRFAPARAMPAGTPPRALRQMPLGRLLGNMAHSVLHKAATGYWRIGDPANGYTAVHARALERIGIDKLADCFFFETDMLFRLNLVDAVVADVALPACYPGSGSSLRLRRVAPRFALLTASRCVRRLRTKYFSGRWNLGSFKLAAGLAMFTAAAALATSRWVGRHQPGEAEAGLGCLLLGLAFLAGAALYDARNAAREPLWRRNSHC